jgi:hypothetical protein|tara:strand:+ start:217 stop:483 length:267 start_codon:yes stop_codon:yes gene_type:complete
MSVVQLFNVCHHVPNLRTKEDVAGVLKYFSCEQGDVDEISEYVEANYAIEGVAMKNLVLAISLSAQKSPSRAVEAEAFKEKIQSLLPI